ncbi:MAG: transcriptional regulator, GntR family [Solirubrobacterales bacterium]|nr:transcriptional regulator, GntR family [Solirubrobacterales bacterium]
MIVAGDLAPGTRLRQVEVAAHFSVSTTPVREAFTSLAREGFVRQDAHRGVEVFRPSVKDIQENYEIRCALEPLAAKIAARLISEDDLGHLDRILAEMEQPVEFELGTELNRRFHFMIYRAAERPQLLEMIERLRHAADAYVQVFIAKTTPSYRDAVRTEHREILAGLQERAPERVHQAVTAHLRHNLDVISNLVTED